MVLISLQSGSSGNCIYVESEGTRILFDAGLNPTQVEQRLALYGLDPRSITALVISHNHSDHVRYAASCSRKFQIPLCITQDTLQTSKRTMGPRECSEIQYFQAGASVSIGKLKVETICTPHDAADGVVFAIDDGRHRLGICTDVGHVFQDLKSLVKNVDGLFLESNFDGEMLKNGRYPRFLKERISGPGGHISNAEAAELVAENATSRLQWLCLAHLSAQNNTPKKALTAHRKALGKNLPIHVTSRSHATEMLKLGAGQLNFENL